MSQLLFKYNSGEKMIKSRAILQELDDVKSIMVKNLSKVAYFLKFKIDEVLERG